MSLSEVQDRYRRALVVEHPVKRDTRRYRRALRQVQHLQQATGLTVEAVHTERDSKQTQTKVLESQRPTDLIIVLGGDGTMNTVVNAQLRLEQAERADVLPTKAGSSCDMYRSLIGNITGRTALAHILTSGQRVQVHPLEVAIKKGAFDIPNVQYAVNNAGIQYPARMSQVLNGGDHRNSLIGRVPIAGEHLQNMLTTWRSFSELQTFTSIWDSVGSRELLGMNFIHAERAMRYGRFAIQHTDSEFLSIDQIVAERSAVALDGMRMTFGLLTGERHKYLQFTVGNVPTFGHVDGEPFPIDAGSMVEVGLADSYVTTYSLRSNVVT